MAINDALEHTLDHVIAVPSAKVRLRYPLLCFLFCFALAIAQHGWLDNYFIHFTNDNAWLGLVAGDVIVAIILICLLKRAINYNQRWTHKENSCHDSNLPFAYLAWLAYSVDLSLKIVLTVYVFSDEMMKEPNFYFGGIFYRLILSSSAVVFLLLVLSHHNTKLDSPRQAYISYLVSYMTLDILDAVMFLDMLYQANLRIAIGRKTLLEGVIIFFTCINFILPTFALFKLKSLEDSTKLTSLPHQTIFNLVYLLVGNIPYLCIRFYVLRNSAIYADSAETTIFIVKNIIMTLIGFREVWLSYLLKGVSSSIQPHTD